MIIGTHDAYHNLAQQDLYEGSDTTDCYKLLRII